MAVIVTPGHQDLLSAPRGTSQPEPSPCRTRLPPADDRGGMMRRVTLAYCAAVVVVLSGCARTAGEAAAGEPPAPDDGKPGVEDCTNPPSPPVPIYTAGATMYGDSEEMSKALGRIHQAGE